MRGENFMVETLKKYFERLNGVAVSGNFIIDSVETISVGVDYHSLNYRCKDDNMLFEDEISDAHPTNIPIASINNCEFEVRSVKIYGLHYIATISEA
jgi:hypothetical protein